MSIDDISPIEWSCDHVERWLISRGHGLYVSLLCNVHSIDGKALLLLTESDLRSLPAGIKALGDLKRLSLSIRQLQMEHQDDILNMGFDPHMFFHSAKPMTVHPFYSYHPMKHGMVHKDTVYSEMVDPHGPQYEHDNETNGLKPEVGKTLLSLFYLFVVTWITAFVMVVVHDRVPDMKKYPPLPDIFLDNVPTIPWAFSMCELTGTLLLLIWLVLLTFHKHRFILLRRFFALSGTVFLLRCVTMLITSLSVPGTHLQCNPRVDEDWEKEMYNSLSRKIQRAYIIWRGAGMSIQGVRTCGDYMFSGHTVALTMLNFFITEYTPRHLYFVHTFTWVLNMFGIFFILSAHEHYSIDVFIAFYITSRLFLYYHTLANNQSLMQRDSNRTRIWFPLFSFFESSLLLFDRGNKSSKILAVVNICVASVVFMVDGIVPNEYESPLVPLGKLWNWIHERVFRLAVLTAQNTQSQFLGKRAPPPDNKLD